jgi:hypothetical protein
MSPRFRSPSFRMIVAGFASVAIAVQPMCADFGPCHVTSAASYQNTIACVNGPSGDAGTCTGEVRIVPQQKACANSDETGCTSLPNDLLVTYQPKAVDQGWATFVYCCELDSFCIACAAVLGIACVAEPSRITCLVAVGCANCVNFTGCLWCCYTTCEQDLSTRAALPGGSNC